MEEYEREIECLKTYLTRRSTQTNSNYRLAKQLIDHHEQHRIVLEKLDEEFHRVESLVSQANNIAYEMHKKVVYKTIVHIPVSYLKANERVSTKIVSRE